MRSPRVVALPPLLNKHFRFNKSVKGFTVQELIMKLSIEALDASVLPWRIGFNEQGFHPDFG
jgi:hypothetical protein